MRAVIASDTHGRTDKLKRLAMQEQADAYWFAGDLCDDPAGLSGWAMVKGNNDHWLGQHLPEVRVLHLGRHKILMTHGHLQGYHKRKEKLAALAKENGCEAVVYGHTHRPEMDMVDGILILNPGSLARPRGPMGCTYLVLDATENGLEPKIVQEKS